MKYLAAATASLLAILALPTGAHAYTLGIADATNAPVAPGQQLGATVYRLVLDPAVGLNAYDARIQEHRAVGQRPQIVVGGIGTQNKDSARGVIPMAVAAAQRYPDAYSISVINEPDLSGMGVCEFAALFLRASKAIHAAGIRRVLFGEFSPHYPLDWTRAMFSRCGPKVARGLRGSIKHFAWHAYDTAQGPIQYTKSLRSQVQKLIRHPVKMYATEYGVTTDLSEPRAVAYWTRALRIARSMLEEIVVYTIHDEANRWNSGLITSAGRVRPAFWTIANRRR